MGDDDCQSMILNNEFVGHEGACQHEVWNKSGGALMWTCLAKSHPITNKCGAWYVQDNIGLDKVERCMCAVKAIALVGDRVFWEAFLKCGSNAKQIVGTTYEELCLFPDDGLQQQSQIAMQETVVPHAVLAVGNEFSCFNCIHRTFGNVAFCVFLIFILFFVIFCGRPRRHWIGQD